MPTPTVPGFGQFIPGFDFLRQLTQTAGQAQQPAGAIPGMPAIPSWSDWVAPTLQPEELQKRIGELKTVQFWLEQNNRAVAATVQALEVQKMTLAALKNMGVPFEQWTEAFRSIAGQATDAASQFWRNGADGAAAMPANPFSAIFGGAQGAAADAAPAGRRALRRPALPRRRRRWQRRGWPASRRRRLPRPGARTATRRRSPALRSRGRPRSTARRARPCS